MENNTGDASKELKHKGITLISSVQTSWSKRKVLEVLEKLKWNSIFLPLPKAWEDAIVALRQGFDFYEIVRDMEDSGVIRLPEDKRLITSWEPLIRGISLIAPSKKIRCYRDISSIDCERQIAIEYMLLALRSRAGRIDVNQWKELIYEEIDISRRESQTDARKLKSEITDSAVCVDSSGDLEASLRSEGIEVRKVIVDMPMLPLDILRNEMKYYITAGREIPDDLVERRIKEHLIFLDLVISSHSFDDAYSEWRLMYRRQN
ncbi:MAG: hypothetical protein QW087_02170 [Methanomassiliicoccales archaeon]